MQKIVYYCDHCKQEIGMKKHLSLRFGGGSGIAIPPNKEHSGWTMKEVQYGRVLQLHFGKCLSDFFKESANGKNKRD